MKRKDLKGFIYEIRENRIKYGKCEIKGIKTSKIKVEEQPFSRAGPATDL